MSQQNIQSEKKKKFANRKIILGISSLLTCLFLVAICSFVPFLIDPTRWQTTEFLTDELLIVAIVITSMVSMMMVGQASNAQNELSALSKSRSKFFESIKLVDNVNFFNQWVRKVLQKNDIRTIKERMMRSMGLYDYTLLDLEISEIKALINTPQKYGERYYKGITKEQAKCIIKLKSKDLHVALVEPEYYLSVKNLIDPRTITERSSREGLKKSLYLTRSVVGKLLVTILSAMIFASLMRDMAEETDTATALMKFASRVWSMITSSFMGYNVGCQINDIDAEYIEMRTMVHQMYSQDKTFKPKDEQAEAKEAFTERVKQENVISLSYNGGK